MVATIVRVQCGANVGYGGWGCRGSIDVGQRQQRCGGKFGGCRGSCGGKVGGCRGRWWCSLCFLREKIFVQNDQQRHFKKHQGIYMI